MKRMWHSSLALAVLACTLAAVQPARAQVAVVTVPSIDGMMSDVKYILKMGGREDLGTQIEGLLSALSPDGKPFAGIDTKRPLGFYAHMPKEGAQPTGVAFIPITKQSELLDLLTKFGVTPEKGDKDVYKVKAPDGNEVFFRFANEHAYIAQKAEHLHGKLAVPSTIIPASHKGNFLAATVRLDEIPKDLKQMALAQVEQQLENEKEKKSGESDLEFQGRQAGMKIVRDVAKSLIDDSKELTFAIQVDQKGNNLAVDLSLSARPGSPLAASFKSFGANRSMFSGLAKNSALNFLAYLPIPTELQATFQKAFDQGFDEALKNAKNDKEREFAKKLIDALRPTLKSDALDVGVVLNGPMDDQKYVVVGGARIRDGKNLEKTLLDILKEIPNKDKQNVKLNVDKAGDANIHMLRPEGSPDEEVKKHLGSQDVYVAFQNDVVLFAVGDHGKKAIKDAVAALKSGTDKSTSPIQFEASASRLAPLVKDENDKAEKFREAAKKLAKDRDRVRISVQGGETLRLRFDAHAELLKLVFELAPLPG